MLLYEIDGDPFMQGESGAHQSMWVDTKISRREFDRIRASGRERADMAFEIDSVNVLPGVTPFWERWPVHYLTWHRDNDPSPWSERAAAALAGLKKDDA